MSQKRMFNNLVVNCDEFLEMPDSSQNLYFHLSMSADDDGFVSNWKSIMRMTGKKEDDLKILIAKAFVIPFDTGVIVIRHWKLNNYIQKDRYKETIYKDEKALLTTDESNVYNLYTKCIPSIDKNSIDKNSIDKKLQDKEKNKHKYGEYGNVLLTDEQYEKLKTEFPNDYEKRIENTDAYVQSTGKKYKDYLATIRNWARKEKKVSKISKYEEEAKNETW